MPSKAILEFLQMHEDDYWYEALLETSGVPSIVFVQVMPKTSYKRTTKFVRHYAQKEIPSMHIESTLYTVL